MDFTVTVGRPFRPVSASSKKATSPRVADMRRKRVWGQGKKRYLPGNPAIAVGVPVELVHHHVVHRRIFPLSQGHVREDLRGARQRTGPPRLTVASPVERPTFVGPSSRQSAIHFSLTSAFDGTGCRRSVAHERET